MRRAMWVRLGAAVICAAMPDTANSQQVMTIREPGAAVVVSADLEPATQAQAPQQPPPPAPATRRRRASVVGYIDDAPIGSKIRLRFDTATESRVPDRAEFFYAKCGCYSELEPHDPGYKNYDPNAPGPRPDIPNHVDYQQLYLEAELAVDTRLSVFGQLPIRWLEPDFRPGEGFSNQAGLSDVRAGIKFGLLDSASPHALTAQLQLYFPTGNAGDGLGTNHTSVEPSMLFRQQLTPTASLESQVGVWLPIGGSAPLPGTNTDHFAGRVFYYGIGPGVTVYQTDRLQVTPVLELVGWRVLAGNQTFLDASNPAAAGTNIVNIKFGARIAYNTGSFYVGYGHALTDASWYDDVLRFEYRYAF